MYKKLLAGLILIGLLAFAMGFGTYSWFTDTGYSKDNVFSAGDLDLKLSNSPAWTDNVTSTWSSPANWAPNDTVSGNLSMLNTGSIAVEMVSVHGINLVTGGLSNVTLLTHIAYTELTVMSPNLIGYYKDTGAAGKKMDRNQDGNVTLWEFTEWSKDYSMVFWIGGVPPPQPYLPPNSGRVEKLKLGFTFASWAGNEYMLKTASFDLVVNAYQDWSQITLAGKGGTCYGYS